MHKSCMYIWWHENRTKIFWGNKGDWREQAERSKREVGAVGGSAHQTVHTCMKMPLYNKHHSSSNQRFLPLLDSYFILNCCRSNLHDDVWCLSKYHHALLWKYLFTRSRFVFLTRFFFLKLSLALWKFPTCV